MSPETKLFLDELAALYRKHEKMLAYDRDSRQWYVWDNPSDSDIEEIYRDVVS